MGHAHAGTLPRERDLYEEGGFLDKVRNHPKTAVAAGMALAVGLTGSYLAFGRGNHQLAGEGLNRAVNVPARTEMAIPQNYPASHVVQPPPPGDIRVKKMGRDPAVLKRYFGLTEEQLLVRKGFIDYEFQIANFGQYNGKDMMIISLYGRRSDGRLQGVVEERPQYFGK
jgi:hypothetical protein